MNFSKKRSLLFLIGFLFLIFFSFSQNASAAILGEYCNYQDGTPCEDGSYCYDGICKETCAIPYGDQCINGGYCYDGTCWTGDGESGQPCGTLGGKCLPTGSLGMHDDTGGRGCDHGFWCRVSNKDFDQNVCKDKKDGARCAADGFCYDNKCEITSGTEGDRCGIKKNAKCTQGVIFEKSDGYGGKLTYYECPNDFLGDGTSSLAGGTLPKGLPYRECAPNDRSLLCCAPSGDESEPTDFSSLKPIYKSCTDAQPSEGITGGFTLFKGSIVPCGRNCDDPDTAVNEMDECTACHFILMGKRIYDFVFSLLIIVSVLMITVGGVLYMISGTNPNLNSMAKDVIKKTLIGFGLFLGSWLIVFTVLKMLSVNTSLLGNGTHWYDFSCETKSPFQLDYQNPQDVPGYVDLTAISIDSPVSMSLVAPDTIIKFTDNSSGNLYECAIDNNPSVSCVSGTTTMGDLPGWDNIADGDILELKVIGDGISNPASSSVTKETAPTPPPPPANRFKIDSPSSGDEVESTTPIKFTDPSNKSPYICEIVDGSNTYDKDNCISGTTTFGDFEKWPDIADGATFSLAIISIGSDSGSPLLEPEKTDSVTLKKKPSRTVTNYTYQTGISEQLTDASYALTSLLDCMKDKLPDDAKEISSISDGDNTDYDHDNNTTESILGYCTTTYTNPPCEHDQNSCHYGGSGNCKGASYAIDFTNESYVKEITDAAKACASGAYILKESNHVHVSIGEVSGCGCN